MGFIYVIHLGLNRLAMVMYIFILDKKDRFVNYKGVRAIITLDCGSLNLDARMRVYLTMYPNIKCSKH